MKEIWTQELLDTIRSQFKCDWFGLHGILHWTNVRYNARYQLSHLNDFVVADLFAIFHDAGRVNEHDDFGHGSRGAELAIELHGKLFEATHEQMKQLVFACKYHSDGLVSSNPVVAACWNADRLDLPRVGVSVNQEYLSKIKPLIVTDELIFSSMDRSIAVRKQVLSCFGK